MRIVYTPRAARCGHVSPDDDDAVAARDQLADHRRSPATSKPPQATAEADADQRLTAWRCRQVIAVPAAATAAAASSQERLASTPAMAKNPNAHTSQVVLI
jgi:anti-sigma-K factor RskA